MIRLEAKGFRHTMDVLKELDADVRKEINDALRDTANELRDEARGLVNPDGLSGWKNWRTGYDQSNIRKGIGVTRAKRRKRGTVVSNFIGVQNNTAAGVIWELAGRKTNGAPPRLGINPKTGWTYGNGVGFVNAIRRKSGQQASRLVWGAYDSPQDWNQTEGRDVIVAQIEKATKAAEAKLGELRGA